MAHKGQTAAAESQSQMATLPVKSLQASRCFMTCSYFRCYTDTEDNATQEELSPPVVAGVPWRLTLMSSAWSRASLSSLVTPGNSLREASRRYHWSGPQSPA